MDGLEEEAVDADGWFYALDFNFLKWVLPRGVLLGGDLGTTLVLPVEKGLKGRGWTRGEAGMKGGQGGKKAARLG